jgi:uncharacterized coiled-coil protein SlyX
MTHLNQQNSLVKSMKRILLLIITTFIFGKAGFAQTNYINTTGNVGIGTLSPLEKLHIQNGNLLLAGDGSSYTLGTIKFSTTNYNYAWSGISGVSNGQGLDQIDLLFYTAYGSPGEKMRLMSNTGFLGIGTSSPEAKVHSMYAGEQLRLGYNATNYSSFTTSSSGGLAITPTGGTVNLAGSEIYFTGAQPNQYQNSNSTRLDFVGEGETAGFGIQALNAAFYGTKDLVFYAHNGYLHNDYTSYDEVVRFRYDGNVGIGTATPAAKLDVNGTTYSRKLFVGIPDANTITNMGSNNLLAVNGTAVFVKAKVALYGTAWPDYVFSPTYKLTPLDSLEQFIMQNKHLPEIPSASDVQKSGIDLGNNQALLLKKIEELTLIVIEQNKEIIDLRSNLKDLTKDLRKLQIISNDK